MDEAAAQEFGQQFGDTPQTVGQRLRAARELKGKTLADIASQTRVPVRLLDALERDAVDELPVGPYATGFTRSFAQAVGLRPEDLLDQTRALQQERNYGSSAAIDPYEPADDSRVPPRSLAIIAGVIFLALLGGYFVLRNYTTAPTVAAPAGPAAPAADPATPVATPAAVPTAQPAVAPVALAADARMIVKAYENVWFSLEDERGRSQFDLTLEGGEFYTIRPNQRGLRLRTGKPQAMRIVVGDRELPQLGPPDTVVSGVSLDLPNLGRIAAGGPAMIGPPAAVPPTIPLPPPAR
jgi:cytoskeleton protein RodZ